MHYRLLIITTVLIVAFGCLSPEDTVQELQFFDLDDRGITTATEESISFIVSTSDESVSTTKVDRIINFETGEISNLDGSSEKLKILDTLSFGGDQVTRYIYGMGKVDGLSLLGVSGDGRILFVINPTWKSGAATPNFIEEYEAGMYQEDILRLNLPPPPDPQPFE